MLQRRINEVACCRRNRQYDIYWTLNVDHFIFWSFCCGSYCMIKLWALFLTHYTCKYWDLYTVHIFLLWVSVLDGYIGFYMQTTSSFSLFTGLHIQTVLRILAGFFEDICNPLPYFRYIDRCFLNAKYRRLFRFREDGGCLTRVTTAGFNKQNRQAVCEAGVQKYTQYRLAAIKKQSVPNIFFIFSYFCYTRSIKKRRLIRFTWLIGVSTA